MKMKSKILSLIMLCFGLISMISCEKKVNSIIYYSTQFLDNFNLEEVDEENINKIPLANIYYKIDENKKSISLYDNDKINKISINGIILNDEIYEYNNSYYFVEFDKKYYLYDIDNSKEIDLGFDKKDYDNIHLYTLNDGLYLIGSIDDKTDIFKLSNDFKKEKRYTVEVNTFDGVRFLYFWKDYFVIQNENYEYDTNCDSNLTKIKINNQLDIVNDDLYSIIGFENVGSHPSVCFFKHKLFYENDSYEEKYYKTHKNEDDYYEKLNYDIDYKNTLRQHRLFSNFYDQNIYIDYSGEIEQCFQFYYNHIYYFLLTDWYNPYRQTTLRGYYFIKFDSLKSKFEISELNMDDRVKSVKQIGNQIQMNVLLNYDGKSVNRIYYIK